ncbi:hypothetical protein [Cucumibacter marinus]|nr:hypothetical protein [Cucumibacter marinus]
MKRAILTIADILRGAIFGFLIVLALSEMFFGGEIIIRYAGY